MKVDRIDLYSNDNEVARFDVTGFDVRNPYIIKAITGLDADNIVPRYYGQGLLGSNKFYDLSLEPREIAMRIGLNPNYNVGLSPADLRGDLYRALASNRTGLLQLRFYDNNSVSGIISGFVTKFEAPLFNKETEVQITMRCDDPIIKSGYVTSVVLDGLSKSAPLLIDPISTSPHGFQFQITFTGAASYYRIQNSATPDWQFRLNHSFANGSSLYFGSETGFKYILYDAGAGVIPLMDTLTPGSVWPLIFPGENQFHVTPSTYNWISLYYTETHWGV